MVERGRERGFWVCKRCDLAAVWNDDNELQWSSEDWDAVLREVAEAAAAEERGDDDSREL